MKSEKDYYTRQIDCLRKEIEQGKVSQTIANISAISQPIFD